MPWWPRLLTSGIALLQNRLVQETKTWEFLCFVTWSPRIVPTKSRGTILCIVSWPQGGLIQETAPQCDFEIDAKLLTLQAIHFCSGVVLFYGDLVIVNVVNKTRGPAFGVVLKAFCVDFVRISFEDWITQKSTRKLWPGGDLSRKKKPSEDRLIFGVVARPRMRAIQPKGSLSNSYAVSWPQELVRKAVETISSSLWCVTSPRRRIQEERPRTISRS